MSEAETTPFDATPERALATIEDHTGPIVVDLDETLYLRNSTSDFIASARPSSLAYVLVKLVDVLKPWRRSGGPESRDAWRVRALLTLMPWTLRRWRRQARSAADDAMNEPLVQSLRRADAQVVVATLGFSPIVAPLIEHSGLNGVDVVAMNPWNGRDRERGKLALTEEALGAGAVAESAVITDSPADLELLSASKVPLRVVWPDARPAAIFANTYLPGRYLTVVKRPGDRYIRTKILREDFALWVLASVWLADAPVAHVLGLVLLALSFWAAYEAGYVDNDRIADRFEADPTLSDEFRQGRLDVPFWKPGAWSAVAGMAGVWVIRWPEAPAPLDFARWGGLLVVLLAVFGAYNRLDKSTRVWLFPVLQLLRSAALIALVPIVPIAAVAIVIHVMIRWIGYYVYRLNDGSWVSGDLSVGRLIVFVGSGLLFAATGSWDGLTVAAAVTLLAWHLFLARHHLPQVVAAAHRVDR